MQSTKGQLQLPVGDEPFWDTKREEEASLTSISDSCVVSHSLRQSRDRWIYRTFPKFSSKGRGNKVPDVVPPPHTIQTRGKCDLAIGPHIFTDTIIYEVHYLSQGPIPSPNTASNPVSQTNASPAGPHSYNQSLVTSQSSTPSAPATNPDVSEQEKVSTPLISSLADVTSITPVLINRVNTAASANPILSNLLQLAAAGHASPDQLKTLGLLIQSLANMEEPPAATASIQQPSTAVNHNQRSPPVKDFDLVLEFREAPAERWVFPRVPVYGERKSNPSTSQDILLTTCIPFSVAKNSVSDVSQEPSLETSTETPVQQHVVTLHLTEAPWAIWDTIYRWIGGEDMLRSNKIQIDSLIPPKRMFLGHQLPPGSLLAQLQIASAPAYTMKTLKHGPTAPPRSRPKKTTTQRKQTENNIKDTVSDTNNATAKTPRASQSKPPSPIRCVSCNQTDVPLILGGRFCRPCVDSGRSTANPAHELPPSLPQPAS